MMPEKMSDLTISNKEVPKVDESEALSRSNKEVPEVDEEEALLPKKMIRLMSRDKEVFEVEESVALQSKTLKHMIEDDCADNIIPIPNVEAKILSKVIEYCKKHEELKDNDADLSLFDKEFIDKDDMDTLYFLILAANYLAIEGLLNFGAQTVADIIKGKSPEQIREKFNIKNDLAPEEEEAYRKENRWAFDNPSTGPSSSSS